MRRLLTVAKRVPSLARERLRAPEFRAANGLRKPARTRRRLGSGSAIALALLAAPLAPETLVTAGALAQTLQQNDPNAQLLLKADQIVYDNDAEQVTAIGDVQLDYDGYNVVAERVTYNQRTRRVLASGNVEILEPNGNRIYADEIDLTDDFSDGFVNALRVETPDNTRFAAESAERFEGKRTVFNNGVYTACEPCRERPDRAPLWQVKAERVILNGETKTVSYRNASFELFGQPIAFLPYFSHADPSVKRKSGFLVPGAGYDSNLGLWYRQPYFLVTGDSHDLTFSLTGFSNQGLLGEVRWRHQLENGFYTLRAAGIRQEDPTVFDNAPDNAEDLRGMVSSTGKFTINPRWTFGWSVLAQSDRNFSRTYDLDDLSGHNVLNEVYLRGLNDKSYFDLSAYQFLIQRQLYTAGSLNAANAFLNEDLQALVRPVLDYNYVNTENATGGQVSLDVNVASLDRDALNALTPASGDVRTHGIDGDTTRLSADLAWKQTVTTAPGVLITPSVSLRGDVTTTDGFADPASEPVDNDTVGRFMPTAGLKVSYPLLARTANGSHVFEPIAQLLVRPSLNYDGVLPNEDAQSLVFDTTNLFARDKFSGYDRIEGGTRANIGMRYSGLLDNGLALDATIGQSFHLAGRNPYAREDDLVNAGEESGLETDRSDYVASFGVGFENGFGLNTQMRLDENDLNLRRSETLITYAATNLSFTANYTYIDAQPDYAFADERQQVGFTASYRFAENWTAFGGAQYDMEDNIFVSDQFGMRYNDECFTFSLAFNETRNQASASNQSITFNVALRTIGDLQGSVNTTTLDDLTDGDLF